MTWLVTGAAGYIGSAVTHHLLSRDIPTVGMDNFFSPNSVVNRSLIGDRLHYGDIRNLDDVLRILDSVRGVVGVIHCAGLKSAPESVLRPLDYFSVNAEGTRVLLQACEFMGVRNFIFSSSCSVYGPTATLRPSSEGYFPAPMSPYAWSKLSAEMTLRAWSESRPEVERRFCALRYFNVVGQSEGGASDIHPTSLIPALLAANASGQRLAVFTRSDGGGDGTCIRDYIHIDDIALAHVLAAERMARAESLPPVINLGSGVGFSTLQIVEAFAQQFRSAPEIDLHPPRPGDPPVALAEVSLALDALGWRPTKSLDDAIASLVR